MILLSILMRPFSWFYGMVLFFRHWAYDKGYKKRYSFKTPSICVGNLSLGGTGKTPMVELLLRHYQADKYVRTAVLSRGYGRISQGLVLGTSLSTVEDLGDEPYQIAQSFPETTLVVSASRVAGMSYLEGLEPAAPHVVVLDDALQHRAIQASFTILLTTFSQPFYRDKLLPSGRLRDLPSRAQAADVLVVTKCPSDLSNAQRKEMLTHFSSHFKKLICFSYLDYDPVWKGLEASVKASDYIGKEINLITAIAQPEPLLRYLEGMGIKYKHWRFKDHHFFTPNEIAQLEELSNVVCTQKDFTKLKDRIEGIYYIGVQHVFFEQDAIPFYKALPEVSASI